MEEKDLDLHYKNLAAQLALPTGEDGLQMAEIMHQSNASMVQASIDKVLENKLGAVLEIGHAGGAHISSLLSCSDLVYTGLELSKDMWQLAQHVNSKWVALNRANFVCYQGEKLPFDAAKFDVIFSVNTLYFWPKPLEYLEEIGRVLKPNGKLVLAFGIKEYMQQLPFTQYGFTLYSQDDFLELVKASDFVLKDIKSTEEWIQSKTNESILRKFFTVELILSN